jgi:RNA polymerase sigma-70 factor (ECF subfamily)
MADVSSSTSPDYDELDEQALVDRILAGERAAFVAFVDRYKRLVQHVVFRMVDDPRDREELCQDVFVRAHRYLDGFRFESKLSTWMAKIARNTCLNHLEKKEMPLYADEAPSSRGNSADARDVLGRVPDPSGGPDAEATERDRREILRAAIEALPEHYRTALTLYHLEGMSVRQIADVMDNPEGTVKSHLYRARRKLKDRLLARLDEPDRHL